MKRIISLNYSSIFSTRSNYFFPKDPKISKFYASPKAFNNDLRLRNPTYQSFCTSTIKINENVTSEENCLEVRKYTFDEYENIMGKGSLYSNKVKITKTLKQFISDYKHLEKGTQLPEDIQTVTGRVVNKRESSKKLVFYDIMRDDEKIQVMSSLKHYQNKEQFSVVHDFIKKGDYISITGNPGKTNVGELSIFPNEITVLSPCMHEIPRIIKHTDTRFAKRYLDLLVNKSSREVLLTRAKVISYLRKFLESRGFIEFETPILGVAAGGATAAPFQTHSKAIGNDLILRISPELYLKQLVVSGFDKVFEIGKQFRNEGIDHTHNPEFTTCEFYESFATYENLMKTTEDFLSGVVKEVTGSTKIVMNKDSENPIEIDFTPPFKRISMVEELEKFVGPLPNLNDENSAEILFDLIEKYGISKSGPLTSAKLFERLFSHFVEPLCINPTFVYDHPVALSPLARMHDVKEGITERFELYINGSEICNAYSELNNPKEQRERFEQQTKFKHLGDHEIPPSDEAFCVALEYGLPPTGGWGLGIDRLCMLLTGTHSIKEVIPFPIMRMHQDNPLTEINKLAHKSHHGQHPHQHTPTNSNQTE